MPQAFPLLGRHQAYSRIVQASPFCRHHGIKVTGTVAFHDIQLDNDGMLILDIRKMTRVSRLIGK